MLRTLDVERVALVTKMRLRYGLVTTFLLLPLYGQGAAALTDDAVTMRVSHDRTIGDRLVFEFSGTVPAARRGDRVDVLARACGVRGFRLIGGTQARASGRWRREYPPEPIRLFRYPEIESGATFRARWKARLSAPYVYREEAPITVSKVPGRLARSVHVRPPIPGTVSMKGELVLLQRLRGRGWVTIRSAQLAYKPSYERGALNHEATFPVQYGWTLRVVLPAKSAAPCYRATATEPFRIWS